MTGRTANLETADGTALLTRHWPAERPWGAVLIVHGLGEHSARYDHVAAYFTARGLETFSFDLRGHGRSGGARMDVEQFERYLDDVEVVLETHVRPSGVPVVLYGHSLGGLICAEYVAAGRPAPDVLILSAPALDSDVPGLLQAAAGPLRRLAPGLRLPTLIKGKQLSSDPAVGEAYFADPLVETKATTRLGHEVFRAQGRARQRVDAWEVPTLVFHGADDTLVPPHASAPLAANDSCERRLFAGYRHELHNEEQYEEVLAFVVEWLESQLRTV